MASFIFLPLLLILCSDSKRHGEWFHEICCWMNALEDIGTHSVRMSTLQVLSLSLLTSRIELAAWCKQYRTFFTKCKITAMMSLSFGNVSGNSSIWFALSLLSCTLYTSWLFGCFVFCFYFIKFHFFVFCICLYLLMLQHISKGLKLSRTRSMYFFFRTYNGTTYTK